MSKHSSPLVSPPPPPPGPFDLPLPDGIQDQLNPEQAKKVTGVQVKFAQGVSELLTKSFGEVSDILGEKEAQPAATAAKAKPTP